MDANFRCFLSNARSRQHRHLGFHNNRSYPRMITIGTSDVDLTCVYFRSAWAHDDFTLQNRSNTIFEAFAIDLPLFIILYCIINWFILFRRPPARPPLCGAEGWMITSVVSLVTLALASAAIGALIATVVSQNDDNNENCPAAITPPSPSSVCTECAECYTCVGAYTGNIRNNECDIILFITFNFEIKGRWIKGRRDITDICPHRRVILKLFPVFVMSNKSHSLIHD